MKKIVAIIGMVLLLAGIVWAAEYSLSSGSKTASAVIDSGPGLFDGFAFMTDGTNPVTVTVYDNTATSGTVLWPATVIPTSSTNRAFAISLDPPLRYSVGLSVLATAGAGTFTYIIPYRKY